MPSRHPKRRSTPSRRIRYAVVGLGHIAQVAVLPAFRHTTNSVLTGLVSGDRKKLAALGRKYDVPHTWTYEQFDECLANPEIDAVYIALPNDYHLSYALRAAAAGKHILCEKPLAMSEAEGRMMADVARAHGVRLMTAYRLHFEPATLDALKVVRSGRLGDLRYFSSTFSYKVTDDDNIRLQERRGGGPVLDIGVYCINAARQLMGDEPVEVAGFVTSSDDPRFTEVEETAGALLRFTRGRIATFAVSFNAADAARLEIVGTKGRLVLDPAFEYAEPLQWELTVGGKTTTRKFPHTDQFAGEIEAFSDCILHDREPEPSAEEGIADLRVIEALFASAAKHRTVRLEPFERTRRPTGKQVKHRPPVRSKPRTVRVDPPHD